MKHVLALLGLLFFLVATPGLAQDPVIATSQGHQLRQSHLMPPLELLQFLCQSELTSQEVEAVAMELRSEFLNSPAALLQSVKDLEAALTTAQGTNDPMLLGQFRQELIWEFYQIAQSPEGESTYLKVLFDKAPVVALDPNTKVALTRPDLIACLAYFKALNDYRGTEVPEGQLLQAAEEVQAGFGQLDAETQKIMASGTVLLSVLQGNMASMSESQQSEVKSHYRTTTGGPPGLTRGAPLTAAESLARDSLSNTQSMMSSLKEAGGTEDYWKLQTR